MTEAERYARRVVDKETLACHWIIQACKRFLSDLQRKDIYFDEEEANRVVNFFELYLCHWEGKWAGDPMLLEDWQKFILQQIFAWKRVDTKLRRFRRAYIQIARKNGKTSFAAGIALYHLIADSENAPQVFVGANNEDQAKICTNTCGRIIEASPRLRKLLQSGQIKLTSYNNKVHTVTYRSKNGQINAMSRDAGTKDGFNPSLVIIDEYHEAKNDKLLNVGSSGQGAREQPLLLTITTAGFNKQGPCYSQLRKMSTEILDGISNDDSFLPILFEQDADDDWKDITLFPKSNPNMGVSVFPSFLTDRLSEAILQGGTTEVDFKTKNLNTWCDAAKVWIPDAVWIANTNLEIKPSDLKGAVCYGGLDCAKSVDLNAFILLFPEFREVKGKVISAFLPFFWLPEEKLKTPDHINYHKWCDDKHIFKTEGNIADYNQIEHDILRLIEQYDFQGLDYDHAYAGNVASNLANQGVQCTSLRQGFLSLTAPTNELERMAVGGLLEHFNNPVMRWMISNVVLDVDAAGNIKPNKAKSQNKIDGVAALINAIARWKREGAQPIDYTFTSLT
jgi:phage terminase large subunit-like protein